MFVVMVNPIMNVLDAKIGNTDKGTVEWDAPNWNVSSQFHGQTALYDTYSFWRMQTYHLMSWQTPTVKKVLSQSLDGGLSCEFPSGVRQPP